MNNQIDSNAAGLSPGCPVCGNKLTFRLSRSKKTGKAFIMLACAMDGRHFRGFICDRNYVGRVAEQVEAKQTVEN